VLQWRRSYRTRPPSSEDNSVFEDDPRYAELRPIDLPLTESLADVEARMIPYWNSSVLPALVCGRNVLVVAHGNTLRALTKHIEGLSDTAVESLEIPTARPRVYDVESDGGHVSIVGAVS
jgi:2,3-bisphosphoglycerate-dependent phosphoglycerate mutase